MYLIAQSIQFFCDDYQISFKLYDTEIKDKIKERRLAIEIFYLDCM